MSARVVIGIDLGTTYSLVGALRAGVPVLFPNAMGEVLTPSAVAVDTDGSVLVGEAARAVSLTRPGEAARFFKRDIGTERVHVLAGKKMTPVELSALVLGALKRDAEAALGHEVRAAVVTVPAYFGDAQRQATKDAAALAGLEVERILNEPTAAALAYGIHQRDREVRCVVLDLGGGTFDVTVLEIIEGVIEIASSAGDARLGGEDFTDALAALATERLKKAHPTLKLDEPVTVARVREAAEQAKRRLGSAEATQLVLTGLPSTGEPLDVSLLITRDDLATASAGLLARMRVPIERALRDAEMSAGKIDEVLLVGGATRMRMVAELASTVFGRLPLRSLPPDEAVAHGAAIQAALVAGDAAVEDLVVTDVAPFSIGVETSERLGHRWVPGIFTPILERGTVLPASRAEVLTTVVDDQEVVDLAIYQGEHAAARDNTLLGRLEVTGLPRGRAGSVRVEVRLSYDLSGILEVDVALGGKPHTQTVIQSQKGKLDPAAFERARAALARLKVHPRETLPNRTALARADALHVELTGEPRRILVMEIASFRAALESQDVTRIDAARDRILLVIDQLGRR